MKKMLCKTSKDFGARNRPPQLSKGSAIGRTAHKPGKIGGDESRAKSAKALLALQKGLQVAGRRLRGKTSHGEQISSEKEKLHGGKETE